MAIEIPCTGCGRTLTVGPEHAGKMARCPVCGHITPVPAEGAAPALGGLLPSQAISTGISAPLLWSMRTPEGQEYGPAPREDVDRWVAEGRVTADCQLREGDGAWQNADQVFPVLKPATPIPVWTPAAPAPGGRAPMSTGQFYADRSAGVYPPPGGAYVPQSGTYAPRAAYQTPHRGALILVLGLIGLFTGCAIFSLFAWVLGSSDLREMEAGRMDRSGMDTTRAGMILGMVLSILWILAILAVFGLIVVGVMAG